jgi:hypothetical protein
VVATVRKVLGLGKSGGAGRRIGASGKTGAEESKAVGAFAFIGWEPHLSWLESELADMGALSFRLNQFSKLVPDTPLPSLSFDLILREDTLDFSPRGSGIRHFLDELDAVVKELRTSSGPTSSAVQLIARYLNMGPGRCFEALAGLEFELMYYPEWVDYLLA